LICPSCAEVIDQDNPKFCPFCGVRIESIDLFTLPPEEEKLSVSSPPKETLTPRPLPGLQSASLANNGRICIKCGALNPLDGRFCISCRTKFY
jgi:endogenous inhibitor of DNA gyrase (YacG/DUF329 family)